MNAEEPGKERYPWAGPALFTVVLLALIVFFWWFL
jgi:hypothetical protein